MSRSRFLACLLWTTSLAGCVGIGPADGGPSEDGGGFDATRVDGGADATEDDAGDPDAGGDDGGDPDAGGDDGGIDGGAAPEADAGPSDAGVDGGPTSAALVVARTGDGSGVVTSSPAGIECGSTCIADFTVGSVVTLNATPSSSSTFGGWSGAGCTSTDTCVVTLTAADTVSAEFVLTPFPLTVVPSGMGTVTSSPTGIDCGSTCTASYDPGTMVTLTASAAPDWAFTGWGGACSGVLTHICVVPMTEARTVSVDFVRLFSLITTVFGSSMGKVSSDVYPVIDCGTTCTASYPSGTVVTLSALPYPGSTFIGWESGPSGPCSGAGTECTFTMIATTAVTATFGPE